MRIDIITIFPGMFAPLEQSILKRAAEKKLLEIKLWDLRDFTQDKHRKVDDTAYGGGKGMVFRCEPVFNAVSRAKNENPCGKVIITSPQGSLFTQEAAKKFSREQGLIIICGHYEGIDERVFSIVDYEVSIGDYVLTGGELPAMVITDCVARLIPGVLPKEASVDDSFNGCLLDWPCYTKPEVFNGLRVPEILLSGNHKKIAEWRCKQAEERTRKKRPDLYKKYLKEKS
ncbi:MAG: tRNA (guanosine(37)-N1)-methyltransferase TrmD [Candidatus Omnitrophica bacterium]|nr:tRNA (guanosine(37)-N1)-methyltransferase TrmD [Candidatus Omnitrophota bacterium]